MSRGYFPYNQGPRPITKRQQRVLELVRRSVAERGYPPTLREIGLGMGIRSTNGVNDHLRALERKGFLVRGDLLSRGITLTEKGKGSPAPAPKRHRDREVDPGSVDEGEVAE